MGQNISAISLRVLQLPLEIKILNTKAHHVACHLEFGSFITNSGPKGHVFVKTRPNARSEATRHAGLGRPKKDFTGLKGRLFIPINISHRIPTGMLSKTVNIPLGMKVLYGVLFGWRYNLSPFGTLTAQQKKHHNPLARRNLENRHRLF